MSKRKLFSSLGISSKKFSIIFVLLFNTFIWFFVNLSIISTALKNVDQNSSLAWVTYLIAIVGSDILGALISERGNRFRFIYVWFLLGIISSCLLSFLALNVTFEYLLFIVFFSGVAFGLGMPTALAFFAEYTFFENRGRVGGVIFFVTNLSIPFVALLTRTNLIVASCVAALWRGIGLIVIFLLRPPSEVKEKRKIVSFSAVFSNRAFIFFLVPLFMVCLIDRFERQIFDEYQHLIEWSLLIEPIIGTFSALVSGLLSDWIGRKKVIVFGFVALGLAYAALGVAAGTTFSQYFYIVVDGVAWGIFFVSFLLILWGDLASFIGGQEKHYALGIIPFFIAYLMQYLAKPYIKDVPQEASFSFASLFLFIAILPLIYAPETMPEKKIKERQLRKYVEEAKKEAEKW